MQHLNRLGLEQIGNGQVRITDFERFSKKMNWTPGGEAYTEAYNAYRDSLIELDRKVGKAAVEEIKSISEAHTGDKINITYLSKIIQNSDEAINNALRGMSAQVTDGILEINDGA